MAGSIWEVSWCIIW